MNYDILIPLDLLTPFVYSYDSELPIGQLVIVDFRNREVVGIVGARNDQYNGSIKRISDILPYSIRSVYLDFCEFISKYTLNSIGNVTHLIAPFSIDQLLLPEKNIKSVSSANRVDVQLTSDQAKALKILREQGSGFRTTLLQGVTGSGKTEVFLEYAKNIEQVLIMVPEISLSNELATKTYERLGIPVYIWHHSVSPSKKREIWKKAVNGETMAIVGARSALFIPFAKLGCIIIDEEHDQSFKQSEGITYNARDMAIYLAHLLDIPIILSSATPSIETYQNAISGKYQHIQLQSKYSPIENSNVVINSIQKQKLQGSLNETSIKAIAKCLEKKKQALIFVNRRGHTPKILCSSCSHKIMCPHCDTWLCYHADKNALICHYCGYQTFLPSKCPQCHENSLIGLGCGVEKVASEIEHLFPNAAILCLSSDNMNSPNKISKNIQKIQNHEIDIIIGTQIVSKGHNFKFLNTIVISCIDSMLYGDDFRAAERAFQLTHQIMGRAGRASSSAGATVIIQTYTPDDPMLKLITAGDLDAFYSTEMRNRKETGMPPYGRMIAILISSSDKNALEQFARIICKRSVGISHFFKIIGPIVPSIPKIRNIYRLRFLVVSSSLVQQQLKQWFRSITPPQNIKVSIDVDPYDFS